MEAKECDPIETRVGQQYAKGKMDRKRQQSKGHILVHLAYKIRESTVDVGWVHKDK